MSMSDILGKLSSLADLMELGSDAVLTVLAGIIDGVGTGTEFTGEQLDQLGELAGKLADKVRDLKGATEG